jgi:hypothetical protein
MPNCGKADVSQGLVTAVAVSDDWNWPRRRRFDFLQRQRALHCLDARQAPDARHRKLGIGIQIRSNDLKKEVRAAGDAPAGHDLRQGRDRRFEGARFRRMSLADKRIAIVVDPSLMIGLIANTIATIAIGLGAVEPAFGNMTLTDVAGGRRFTLVPYRGAVCNVLDTLRLVVRSLFPSRKEQDGSRSGGPLA